MERNEIAANMLLNSSGLLVLPPTLAAFQHGVCASVTIGARMMQRSSDPVAITTPRNFMMFIICVAVCSIESDE
jgi:hypothetical protein